MPSTQDDSQGAGHSRPVNSGKLLVACNRSLAARQSRYIVNQWLPALDALPQDGVLLVREASQLAPLASGFGWATRTVDDPDEVRAQLARSVNGVEVLVVPVDPGRSAVR